MTDDSSSSRVKEDKPFKVPVKYTVDKIINFLFVEQNLQKYVITTSADKNNASAHLQLLLKSNV